MPEEAEGKRKEDGTPQEEKLPMDCPAMLTMASYGVVGSDFARKDFWCLSQGNTRPPGQRGGPGQCFHPPGHPRERVVAGEQSSFPATADSLLG